MPVIILEKKSIVIYLHSLDHTLIDEIKTDLTNHLYDNDIWSWEHNSEGNYIVVYGRRKQLYKFLRSLATITDFMTRTI